MSAQNADNFSDVIFFFRASLPWLDKANVDRIAERASEFAAFVSEARHRRRRNIALQAEAIA